MAKNYPRLLAEHPERMVTYPETQAGTSPHATFQPCIPSHPRRYHSWFWPGSYHHRLRAEKKLFDGLFVNRHWPLPSPLSTQPSPGWLGPPRPPLQILLSSPTRPQRICLISHAPLCPLNSCLRPLAQSRLVHRTRGRHCLHCQKALSTYHRNWIWSSPFCANSSARMGHSSNSAVSSQTPKRVPRSGVAAIQHRELSFSSCDTSSAACAKITCVSP